MPRQKLYLGVDCGGTKTEALICDQLGQVLGHGISASSNLHNQDLDQVIENIQQAVESAQVNLGSHSIQATCLGVSGLDTDLDKLRFTSCLSRAQRIDWINRSQHIITTNDGLISFKAGTEASFGICLISSTGSVCYGVNESGHEHKAGDWGYLLGDQGSGFAIGLKLIHQVLKEFDGRSSPAALSSIVLPYLHLKNPLELISWTYHPHPPIAQIASLSKLLVDPRLIHQQFIQQIVEQTIEALVDSYRAVVSVLSFKQVNKFPVVLSGGVFRLSDDFKHSVIRGIKSITPQADVNVSHHAPVYGAVKIAQESEKQ